MPLILGDLNETKPLCYLDPYGADSDTHARNKSLVWDSDDSDTAVRSSTQLKLPRRGQYMRVVK